MLSVSHQSQASTVARFPADAPQVFVVEDDISMRESIGSLVRYAGWDCETFASAEEFLAWPRPLVPSCLILDYRLPQLSGLDLQRRLATEGVVLPIIFITYFADAPMAIRAMKAGALELLVKPFDDEVLIGSIHQGIARSRMGLAREAERHRLQSCYATLSRRERQIMARVVAGSLNKHISKELQISEITVKAHRGRVMRKMAAASLAELVRFAIKLDLESMPVP